MCIYLMLDIYIFNNKLKKKKNTSLVNNEYLLTYTPNEYEYSIH